MFTVTTFDTIGAREHCNFISSQIPEYIRKVKKCYKRIIKEQARMEAHLNVVLSAIKKEDISSGLVIKDEKPLNKDGHSEAMLNQRFSGIGTYSNTEITYKGKFLNGKFHGYGEITYSSGTTYKGEWVNGMLEGYGELKHFHNVTHRGFWESNRKQGEGLVVNGTNLTYVGFYANNKRDGVGKELFLNSSEFIGKYKSGDMVEGQLVYANKDCYTGQFMNSERHGYGNMDYTNGKSYEGKWRRDNKHRIAEVTYYSTVSLKGIPRITEPRPDRDLPYTREVKKLGDFH